MATNTTGAGNPSSARAKVRSDAPGEPLWHAIPPDEALALLGCTQAGLDSADARRRLDTHGRNVIAKGRRETPLELFWRQLNNPLIFVLLGAGVLAVAMGKLLDGMVVLGVVFLNAVIGFVQEFRAGKAIEALAAMVPENTTVIRDGQRATINAAELVPGDLVALASGDKVPADLRITAVRNLQVNEASLTGESVPVEKALQPLSPETVLADRRNMCYGGTLVTYGTATAVVVGTGADTELGRISALLKESAELETPLTRSIGKVAKALTGGIVLVAAVLVGVALLRGYQLADAILASITLAVAAIPEGLPAIFTIALAIGVQRMAARRAIIRKLPAVETLGSTTVICSDKTGTLTRNEMTVQALATPSGSFEVTGVGYEPRGELRQNGETTPVGAEVRALLEAGVLCNDAALVSEDGSYKLTGDPTEGALLVAGEKLGVPIKSTRSGNPRVDSIPFESERQFMATLNRDGAGISTLYLKGAPEVVLARCELSGQARETVLAKVERFASGGMRVLAFACKKFPTAPVVLDEKEHPEGMVFLGLQAMIDPPRPEAVAAIRRCHEAGITVKMITGDHKLTAQAIGRELGISTGQPAITGARLSETSDEDLADVARDNNIFARVAPEHKLRLVRALQARGNVVAMTGDGVNDAPALKQSDIGVAMGITGTAVSKEAADIVLTDDNFASIAAAVEEGRRVYDNLIKSLAFVLPTNLGEAFIILVAVAAFPLMANGAPLMPIEPVQILWINLVATVALALPLAFEAMEPKIMSRPPRRLDEPVLGPFVVARTVIVSLLMTVGALALFWYEWTVAQAAGGDPEAALKEAQTMTVTTVVLFQIFYLLNCRSLKDSVLKIGLFSNNTVYLGIGALLLLQLGFVYLPFMNMLFGSAPLPIEAWLKAALAGAVILPVISLEKWWRARAAAT
ncbi:MAG: HAD-IC family P-type ATPase [Candidatus Sumerlaeia bacterium]|nr:HAD-IC family P-type ATPase [Candidatus Sumerlaeia bacterium]